MTASVPGSSPGDRLVHSLAGYISKLAMLALAQRTQPLEGFLLGNAAPTHQDPDSSINDTADFQGGLQAVGEPSSLCQDVGVLDGDCGRCGEDLPEFGSPIVEGVLTVGVDVHRADDAVGRDQWQRHDTMNAEPGNPASEPRPPRISAE